MPVVWAAKAAVAKRRQRAAETAARARTMAAGKRR